MNKSIKSRLVLLTAMLLFTDQVSSLKCYASTQQGEVESINSKDQACDEPNAKCLRLEFAEIAVEGFVYLHSFNLAWFVKKTSKT